MNSEESLVRRSRAFGMIAEAIESTEADRRGATTLAAFEIATDTQALAQRAWKILDDLTDAERDDPGLTAAELGEVSRDDRHELIRLFVELMQKQPGQKRG